MALTDHACRSARIGGSGGRLRTSHARRLGLTSRRRHVLCAWLLVGLILSAWAQPAMAQSPALEWSALRDVAASNPGDTVAEFGAFAVDRYQNTHMIWGKRDSPVGAMYYASDAGGGWSEPVDVVMSPEKLFFWTDAEISPVTDRLHVVFVTDFIGGSLYHTSVPIAQADNTRAWDEPALIASAVWVGTMAIDSQGVLHLVYDQSDSSGLLNAIYYVRSDIAGQTWSEPVLVHEFSTSVPSSTMSFLSIDGRGRLHLGLTLRSLVYGTESEVGYVRSIDGGQSWEPYLVVDQIGTSFQGVSMLSTYAFGDDDVHLTWHGPDRLHKRSSDGGKTWGPTTEIISLGAAFGGTNGLVQDSAGTIYAVTAMVGVICVSEYADGVWREGQRLECPWMDPHGQRIAVSQGNLLHVTGYSNTGANGVWYAWARTGAPAIPQQPLPTAVPSPTVFFTPTPQAIIVPTRQYAAATQTESQGDAMPTVTVVLMAAASGIMLMAPFLIWSWRKGNR